MWRLCRNARPVCAIHSIEAVCTTSMGTELKSFTLYHQQGRRQRGGQWCPAPHFTLGPLVAAYIQYTIFKMCSPLLIFGPSSFLAPCCYILATGLTTSMVISRRACLGETHGTWGPKKHLNHSPADDHVLLECGCEYCIYWQQCCPLTGRICVDH